MRFKISRRYANHMIVGHVTRCLSEMATRSDKRRKAAEKPAYESTALYHWAVYILGNDTRFSRVDRASRVASDLRAGESNGTLETAK